MQIITIAVVLVLVAYAVSFFWHSLAFVVFCFGLMCMAGLFSVGGMMQDKKASRRSKIAVFCLGVGLIAFGILLLWLNL